MSAGSEDRLREAAEVFGELIDEPPADVARRLEGLQERDPELAAVVRDLLRADAEAGSFLEEGPRAYARGVFEESSGSAAGEHIGPYVLVSLLGRGGMGEVWVAERRDGQFEQNVALKLLRRGIDSEGIRRRFLQERQVLARLDHPNIARLLDGGEASDGRPYFVMELVEGEPITKFSREHEASVEERLRLVATCAEATAAAHRRLVVHRDIKPSNVLVSGDGRVKLLDFGIAKVLSDDAASTQWTRAEERVLTPTYAAPEQILGDPVTTATDVYALGVVLYELLTGAPPHDRTSRSAAKLAAQVERETLERPSRAVTASGGTDARSSRRLARRLEGDVDAIVQKALRREPERRYPGAAELGEDLRRHLAGLRVEARPDTLAYRAGKFIRRHRAGVAAAVLVVLALVAGLAATLAGAGRASRTPSGRNASRSFWWGCFRARTLSMPEAKRFGPRLFRLRHPPDRGGSARRAGGSGVLYDVVARIQTGLGSIPEAQALAQRALAERRRLFGKDDPRTMQSLVTLAEVRTALADEKEAEKLVRTAVFRTLRSAYGEDGDETIRARELLVNVLVNEGIQRRVLGLAQALMASRVRAVLAPTALRRPTTCTRWE